MTTWTYLFTMDSLDTLPPGCWTPEAILENLPSGAPSLDDQTVKWYNSLSLVSLSNLAILLDRCVGGVVPSWWRYARVTLIPKPGDALERAP